MITRGVLANNGGATHWPSIASSTIAKYRFFPGDGLDVERPGVPVACISSNSSRCLIDSTGATSGIDSFAIRWSNSDEGSFIDGLVRWGGISFGMVVRVVDLSPSINFFTVSDIFGCVEDFGSGCVVDRFRDISGTLGTLVGVGMLGRLLLSDSSILGDGRVVGGGGVCSDFLNGVTSLNDGTTGAGFTAG